jgi:hypothetical protein
MAFSSGNSGYGLFGETKALAWIIGRLSVIKAQLSQDGPI